MSILNKFAIIVLLLCFNPLATAGNDAPDQKPFYYELDTWGRNSDVYEFTPVNAPWKLCVVFLTDSDLRPAMQCFDKYNADEIKDKLRKSKK